MTTVLEPGMPESTVMTADRRGLSTFTIDTLLQRNLPTNGGESGRAALVYRNESQTFEQLDARAKALAVGLLAQGFQRGDSLCVVAHNCIEWFEIFFALAKIGGVIVPINYLLKPKEISFIVTDADSCWILGDESLWETVLAVQQELGSGVTTISLGHDAGDLSYEALCSTPGTLAQVVIRADELLLLQYTSGTTGFPKGAMHTHETVLWNSIHQIPDFGITRDDVHLVIPAMCWAAGFHSFTLAVLWAGGRVVINPSRGFSAESFCATVEEHRITKTILVPSVLRRVLTYEKLESHDLSSLTLALSGGEPVPVQLIDEWHARVPACALTQGYGMGEFPTLMLYLGPQDATRKAGAAGRACLAAQVRIVNDQFHDVAVEEIGEIVVLSPACMVGYKGKPEATADAFHDGWMRTGDLARIDDEGYLYIAGRAKEMIIVGGLNVYPAEVERVILDLDSVSEVAVVGVPDPIWGEVPEAFVVVKEARTISTADLEAFCRINLANYKIPKRWRISEDPLPRTASGKIQRHIVASTARESDSHDN